MAGHSKWANIKHRKAAQDAKKGKIFTRLIREITISARIGGAEVGNNPRLRAAIHDALDANMTRDTVERAIKRGVGGEDGAQVEEIRYEGYGPGGVAVMVECMTDNKLRTVGEVRHAFTKCGGNLGTDGSVAYLFVKQGVLSFAAGVDEDKLIEVALEAGADDITTNDDGSMDVICKPEQFEGLRDALEAKGLKSDHAEVSMVASLEVEQDLDGATKLLKMTDMMEDLDDVQKVYTNASISPEIMDQIE
ncbi:MAG: YebC/PmpR family DNA-binding transcriptional regulator [Gammaproteobacteria bacterium]|nr:YebC/PmpR family DNA-binding transcriptional regulator [Gammaproteobacteria bacterium]